MAAVKFQIQHDAETDRWFVVDVEHASPYRYPIPYPTREGAEAFMDRLNAIVEGESTAVIDDLRWDADQLRNYAR